MDKNLEKGIITVAAIYAGYLILVKPIVGLFGASPQQQADIAAQDQLDPTVSPFSWQNQNFLNYFMQVNNLPDTSSLCDVAASEQAAYNAANPTPIIDWINNPTGSVAAAAEQIYNAFGFFKWTQDTNAIDAVFNQFTSQMEIGAVAAYLHCNYNVDLWTFLKNGTWNDLRGLSAADLDTLLAKVNALPVGN
jgi:hypothetical protein